MCDDKMFENNGADEIIIETVEPVIENTDSEFEKELENYLPTPENTDKIKKPLPQWVLSAAASLAVCIAALSLYSALVIPNIKPTAVISYSEGTNQAVSEDSTAISDISAKISPSIVTVSSKESYRNFFGLTSSTNSGSGIIIASGGYILTSNSLIGDGSDVTVKLPDKTEYTAKLLGADAAKDIAIIKIEAENLSAATLGNSDTVKSGDMAIVIGNLLGADLGTSVTKGIICGINNGVTLQNGVTINVLQTDAITNSQSAGGCLLNASGEVVGMITYALTSSADNISFAIPSNDIKTISESLINSGAAPTGLMIGITGSDNEHGVTVESVLDDTPAKNAGIKAGDLILKVDNTAVKSISEINKIRDSHKKGDTLLMTIYRDGETIDIEIVL